MRSQSEEPRIDDRGLRIENRELEIGGRAPRIAAEKSLRFSIFDLRSSIFDPRSSILDHGFFQESQKTLRPRMASNAGVRVSEASRARAKLKAMAGPAQR